MTCIMKRWHYEEDDPFWLYNLCIIDVREFVWVNPDSLHRFTGWNTDNGTIIDIKINLILASVETRWSNRRCIYSDLQAATRSSEQRCGSIRQLRTFTWSPCCPQGCLRGQRDTLMEKWVGPDRRNCYQYQFNLPLLCKRTMGLSCSFELRKYIHRKVHAFSHRERIKGAWTKTMSKGHILTYEAPVVLTVRICINPWREITSADIYRNDSGTNLSCRTGWQDKIYPCDQRYRKPTHSLSLFESLNGMLEMHMSGAEQNPE